MWAIFIYSVALAVLACSYTLLSSFVKLFWDVRRIGKRVDQLPGPKRTWILGNMLQVPTDGNKRLAWFAAQCAQFKTAYSWWYGPLRPTVVLCHPSTIKKVMGTAAPKPVSSKRAYRMMEGYLGNGLLLNSGPGWLRNRRLVTPAFHFDVLKHYTKIYNESTDILLEKLVVASTSNDNKKAAIDITTPVLLCTLNVMLRCAFSNADDVQSQGEDNLFVKIIGRQSQLIVRRLFNPLLYFDGIYHLTADGKEWREGCRYSHELAESLIQKRRGELNGWAESEKRAKDFLDILLLAKDEKGIEMTDREIKDEIINFLSAGQDNTASTTFWCLYNLASHPDCQTKARQEVDTILAGRKPAYIEWEDLARLPYLTMCVKESMRLIPTVPVVSRELERPVEIDGVTLEPGTYVDMHIWCVHHHPLVWGDDHGEFKPERFEVEKMKDKDSYAFIPFSAGPRNCIGQHFAMNLVKTVVARILHRFIVEIDPDNKPECLLEVVMKVKNGMQLIMKER